MQLAVHAFMPGNDVQISVPLFTALDQQGAVRVEGTVGLAHFLLHFDRNCGVVIFILCLQHAVDIGPLKGIGAVIGDHNTGTGIADVDFRTVAVTVFPGVVGFINTVEHHCRSHITGQICTVEDQRDFSAFVGEGVILVAEVDPDLSVPGAGKLIGAGTGDVQHRIGPGFFLAVHHAGGNIIPLYRQQCPDVIFVFLIGIIKSPFRLVIVEDLFEAFCRDFRKIGDVVSDIDRVLPGGFAAGEILRRSVFDLVMHDGRVRMPGVIIFRDGFSVQSGGAVVQDDLMYGFIRKNGSRGAKCQQGCQADTVPFL